MLLGNNAQAALAGGARKLTKMAKSQVSPGVRRLRFLQGTVYCVRCVFKGLKGKANVEVRKIPLLAVHPEMIAIQGHSPSFVTLIRRFDEHIFSSHLDESWESRDEPQQKPRVRMPHFSKSVLRAAPAISPL